MKVNIDANVIYGDMTARLDTIGSFTADQINIWRCVQRCNTDWKSTVRHSDDIQEFVKWLAETWGIKLTTVQGSYSADFDVVSPDKYTMFLLKYNK